MAVVKSERKKMSPSIPFGVSYEISISGSLEANNAFFSLKVDFLMTLPARIVTTSPLPVPLSWNLNP